MLSTKAYCLDYNNTICKTLFYLLINYWYSLFAYIVIIFVILCAAWANNWNKIIILYSIKFIGLTQFCRDLGRFRTLTQIRRSIFVKSSCIVNKFWQVFSRHFNAVTFQRENIGCACLLVHLYRYIIFVNISLEAIGQGLINVHVYHIL